MKTPDKIFVSSDPFGFMSGYDMEHHPPQGEEYIRKDALLEWAKETYLNENESAIRKVCYKQLIDKLNSM